MEINGFYSLQTPQSFDGWFAETADEFVFAVKRSRFITHLLRLRNIRKPLANFFASGVLHLGKKLGPFLWQFPPNFSFSAERMDEFFALLPRDTDNAAEIARRHDKRVPRASTSAPRPNQKLRHAVEVRHSSFGTPEFVHLLRAHNVALVFADSVDWPCWMDVTADFIYCRCTVRRSFILAVTTSRLSTSGPRALRRGRAASSPVESNESFQALRRSVRAKSSSISITTPKSALPPMLKDSSRVYEKLFPELLLKVR